MDAVLTWDGYPVPGTEVKDGKRVETYPSARRPNWPEAAFIVGNPPFVAGQDFRDKFGSEYAEALWSVYKPISGGADLVMYWWDRAAETLTRKGFIGCAVRARHDQLYCAGVQPSRRGATLAKQETPVAAHGNSRPPVD